MDVVRLVDARTYIAPKHYDMRSLRLQGVDASAADFAWAGLSYFLPGGGAEMDAGPLGKIYVVIEGEVTIELASGETQVLGKLDSCFIPGGEGRAVRNDGNVIAAMIVVMPYPEKNA
ncbi:cupin domain-containing protein [Novosphingobium pentaromativorans]|uniref:Cupin 2, conserved barrel domain protein n=1 Tax=Novosphingobium pentaromativorans US6-1 TaxID=1088721 RepID=G6EFM4_9SPHN|nr:cupin domain-containing protein [Novosphingobium pentaromativorans]AIT81844.1 cupin [Novosphingobium pentaromativorans US6-1]EHJ59895.1 Cupin 2, conserved barrel domain protein [Novosphingobium pentaromativorans US6-1]